MWKVNSKNKFHILNIGNNKGTESVEKCLDEQTKIRKTLKSFHPHFFF